MIVPSGTPVALPWSAAITDRLGKGTLLNRRLEAHENPRTGTARSSGRDLGLQALSIVSKLRHPWATAEIRRDMGLLYLDMGRRDEARKAFAAAEKALLKLGSVPRAEAMRAQAERPASSRP